MRLSDWFSWLIRKSLLMLGFSCQGYCRLHTVLSEGWWLGVRRFPMKAEEWAGAAVSFRCPDSGSFQDDARPKKPRRPIYEDLKLKDAVSFEAKDLWWSKTKRYPTPKWYKMNGCALIKWFSPCLLSIWRLRYTSAWPHYILLFVYRRIIKRLGNGCMAQWYNRDFATIWPINRYNRGFLVSVFSLDNPLIIVDFEIWKKGGQQRILTTLLVWDARHIVWHFLM